MGGKSELANTLLTSKSKKLEDFFKKCERWLSPVKPRITPVDIVFRFIIEYNSIMDFGP